MCWPSLRRSHQIGRARADAARLDRRVRLSQQRAAAGRGADHDRSRKRPRARGRRRRLDLDGGCGGAGKGLSEARRRRHPGDPGSVFPAQRCAGRILFSRHRGCGRYSRGDLHQSAIPALGPDARRHRAARGASAHRLHQGRLDQYRAAAVDHEPLRRQHQSVLGVGAYPGRGDADRRRRLDGGAGLHHPASKASSSTISARPRAGTRR